MAPSSPNPAGKVHLPPIHDPANMFHESPENTEAPPSPAAHFGFLDLPKDVRRMVYDYLPTLVYRLVSERLYHDLQPPVSLLLTSYFLHDEVKACVDHIRIQYLVTILYKYDEEAVVHQEILDACSIGWYSLLLGKEKIPYDGEVKHEVVKDALYWYGRLTEPIIVKALHHSFELSDRLS
ncbi:hypothetical protein BCR34DRAFT_604341 [Clohesyomyces aquaticus]|uniref:F-box domain-containing protein n=1 Tax=Clohesyomyces aquaticus TaxID=1231657 RepID=A0A1Y1Z741_9PLEO|nr:hypothetical protein BCR34DRAFT_604341 [Clohesyomyces aquaticus]